MTERADRDAILAAARACFQTYGFKATTVEHVAERAGTSRSTVVRLVGGRNKIIDAVLVSEAHELLVELAAVVPSAATLDECIRTIVREALLIIDRRPLLKRAAGPDATTLLPDATTEGLPMIRELATSGRALLGNLRERFGIPDLDSAVFDDLAEDLVRFIIALLHTPTLDGRNRDPEAAAERAANLFVPAFDAAARRARRAQG